jgi:hypothetical protein
MQITEVFNNNDALPLPPEIVIFKGAEARPFAMTRNLEGPFSIFLS